LWWVFPLMQPSSCMEALWLRFLLLLPGDVHQSPEVCSAVHMWGQKFGSVVGPLGANTKKWVAAISKWMPLIVHFLVNAQDFRRFSRNIKNRFQRSTEFITATLWEVTCLSAPFLSLPPHF
jgi:hypothetical protein